MSQDGRRLARGPGIRQLMDLWDRARRAGASETRQSRRVRLLTGIDELESRALLSLAKVIGPMPAPPSNPTPADETINLQLRNPGRTRHFRN